MKGIKFISYHEPSGYAIAGYRYLRGLINSEVPITWTPMVVGSNWGTEYQPFLGSDPGIAEFSSICNADVEYDTVIIHTTPEYFPLWIVDLFSVPPVRKFACIRLITSTEKVRIPTCFF